MNDLLIFPPVALSRLSDYLLHVVCGVSQSRVAVIRGVSQAAVSRSVAVVEGLRDNPAWDCAIECLSVAALDRPVGPDFCRQWFWDALDGRGASRSITESAGVLFDPRVRVLFSAGFDVCPFSFKGGRAGKRSLSSRAVAAGVVFGWLRADACVGRVTSLSLTDAAAQSLRQNLGAPSVADWPAVWALGLGGDHLFAAVRFWRGFVGASADYDRVRAAMPEPLLGVLDCCVGRGMGLGDAERQLRLPQSSARHLLTGAIGVLAALYAAYDEARAA